MYYKNKSTYIFNIHPIFVSFGVYFNNYILLLGAEISPLFWRKGHPLSLGEEHQVTEPEVYLAVAGVYKVPHYPPPPPGGGEVFKILGEEI